MQQPSCKKSSLVYITLRIQDIVILNRIELIDGINII